MRGTKSLLRSIDKMIGALQTDVPKAIENKVGESSASAYHAFASAQYDGVNDVVVDMESGDNTWKITASGDAVLFIEYGTGLRFKHDSQFGDYGQYDPGSWSGTHGRYLFRPKWVFWHDWWPVPGYGQTYQTLGNPSANVMYNTQKNLESTLLTEANSALGKAIK